VRATLIESGRRTLFPEEVMLIAPRRRFEPLLLVACVLAGGIPSGAVGPAEGTGGGSDREAAREIMSRFDKRLRSVGTMRGRFVQTFTSSGLGVPQSEGGRFYLIRPDLMRWDYTSPERKTAVSDGTHTWLYMQEDDVVYRGSVAAWKSGGAFAILAGGSLMEEYDPVEAEARTAKRRGDIVLTVRPRREHDDYSTLLLEIEPKELKLASVTAVDGAGNRITVNFSDVEENVRLQRDLFSFSPPPGARIIDQDSPPPRP